MILLLIQKFPCGNSEASPPALSVRIAKTKKRKKKKARLGFINKRLEQDIT